MTKKEIYERIVDLTARIAEKGIAMELVKAAKTGDTEKVKEVFETFKKENSELYHSIGELSKGYEELEKPYIFAIYSKNVDDKDLFKYDPKEVNPFNCYFMMFFAEINDTNLFEDFTMLIAELEEEHPKMAKYLKNKNVTYPCYNMLVEIFAE